VATVTFNNETASGWQQALFSSPVAITAGTVYVASYLAPAGHYAADNGYFASAGVDNAPLHALQDGSVAATASTPTAPPAASPTTPGFPNNTWQSSNYWVDVVFTTG
jgi:Domain of unknown function (DUF4082)